MDLELLGWSAYWAEVWSEHARAGLLAARVACTEGHAVVVWGRFGERRARVSGRLRHAARDASGLPATGDWVALASAAEPAASDFLDIDSVLPRRSVFLRQAAGGRTGAQVVAANVDTLLVVAGLDGDFNPRRLERTLVLAYESGARPVLVLNKADLCPAPAERLREAAAIGGGAAVHVVSALTGAGLEALAPYLVRGHTAAVVGSSGAGKSTLANRLLGQDRQEVAPVREHDQRGRHTTTRRELFLLPSGACLIDTPGLRELQLWVDGGGADRVFDEIAELAAGCRFRDCRHLAEPGCAVRAAAEEGRLDEDRLRSYRKLQRERRAGDARREDWRRSQAQAAERSVHRLAKRFRTRGF